MATDSSHSHRFAIAVSFPGEHRRFVKNVVDRLADVLGRDRVFYDEWYESELAGLDGDLKLRRYYREQSDMVVPFFSQHYQKDWCKIEWSAIRSMLKSRRKEDAVIPISLDNTEVEGWENIDFAVRRKKRTGKQIADLIIEAYRHRFPDANEGAAPNEHAGPEKEAASSEAAQIPSAASPETNQKKSSISWTTRLSHAARKLIGREEELARLDRAWNDSQTNVIVVRGKGGEGKTSLVTTWMAELAEQGWRGAERVFDWSFYSQGTRDEGAASADSFIDAALRNFGDPDPTVGSPWDRGERLARLVSQSRCLLVLDGMEPLQYPPGPMSGKLKDPGVSALLKGLAANGNGLCVVTTREQVEDLDRFYEHTCEDMPLNALSDLAGAALLHVSGTRRAGEQTIEPDDPELQTASREVRGHALTLMLVGQYLRLMTPREFGDIRQRDKMKLAEADAQYKTDATRPYGHAFKAIEAYEVWLSGSGIGFQPVDSSEDDDSKDHDSKNDRLEAYPTLDSQRQLAALRLLGLFDRPANKGCLAALRAEPIKGLNEPLVNCSDIEWNIALSRLAEINLITVANDESVDCHPLIREYFAMQLRSIGPRPVNEPVSSNEHGPRAHATSEAYRLAHRRLYEHLCETTKEGDQPTLEDLQPLYQAVAHGCRAGAVKDAYEEVYFKRIKRRNEYYSARQLGAFGSDLGVIACFFEEPWRRISRGLDQGKQALVLSQAATWLRALGRLTECLQPMKAALSLGVAQANWRHASVYASNLSELELMLGDVSGALSDAERSVSYADQSGDAFRRIVARTTHADALHQSGGGLGFQPMSAAGSRSHPESLFREAEQMQVEYLPAYPPLYSVHGFMYCDLLLAPVERQAWRKSLELRVQGSEQEDDGINRQGSSIDAVLSSLDFLKTCRAVTDRATQTLKVVEAENWLLDIALDRLTLARVALYEAILSGSEISNSESQIDSAMSGLRRAGRQDFLPGGLLTRALHRSIRCVKTGPESAQSDLDEAWEIASRGPMPLFMVDIHLHRARLFGVGPVPTSQPNSESGRWEPALPIVQTATPAANDVGSPYPWKSVEHDLAEARRLIEKHGYGRRLEELEDAERVLLQ